MAPSGVIDPYDYRVSQMGHVILNFARGELKGSVDGAYDFVDVQDVTEGMILAAQNGINGKIYILSGERRTVEALLLKLEKITGRKPPMFKASLWLAR